MVAAHANTMYPNLPENFHTLLFSARRKKGLTQKALGDLVGCSTVTISSYEKQRRNISHEMALKLKTALDLEIDLPEPDRTLTEIRPRRSDAVKREPFLIKLDGEIIQVLTYRNLGSAKAASRV